MDDECKGCIREPTQEDPTYDEECMGCARFYADLFMTLEPVAELDGDDHAR